MTLFDELSRVWNGGAGRESAVAALKSERAGMLDAMRRTLDTPKTVGLEAMFAHADALDSMLRDLFAFACATGNVRDRLALVAVGGYGRRELAPFSDVDILFLFDAETPEIRDAVALITSLLWDAGLKVGASARTPAECVVEARRDFSVRTNLLESRIICGDGALFDDFCRLYNGLRAENGGADFVEAKLEERARRYRRMGQSKYMLEPNVKEGRGGLRDLHLLFWLAKYLYGVTDMIDWTRSGILSPVACHKFLKAHRFLATVRCHLHLLNNKAGDILTFDAQQKIAGIMGYFDRTGQAAVERFMKRYYLISKTVGELSGQVIVAVTDAIKGENIVRTLSETTDFYLTNDRLAFKDHLHFNEDPLVLLRAFVWRQRLKKSLNPRALQLISDNAKLIRRARGSTKARDLFFEILLSDNPETALRQMTETGVLGCLIPEFQNIVAQVQFDLYHVYTTDEHTLKTIGFLSETPADKTPQSRLALYLGALLHDIGKGLGGDHARKGAALCEKISADLKLDSDVSETLVWLVAHHLMMSQTAFRRDIFDPKTVADFVAVVQSPERLKLLYALTVADIKAVGANVYNSFKAKLLDDLYTFALEKMQGADGRARELTPAQTALAARAAERKYAFSVSTDAERLVTEFIVLAPDRDGLFAEITGAMALEDVSVVEAQIATLENGMALDTFLIQETTILNERKPLDSEKKIARLQSKIEHADAAEIEQKLSAKRAKTPASVLWCPPRVFINNAASDACSLIEINGADGIGFLHAVTRTMTKLRLNIVSAHVYTYGARVVDVFYVTGENGAKITDEEHVRRIKSALLEAIDGSSPFSR